MTVHRAFFILVLLASQASWATDQYPGLIEAKYGLAGPPPQSCSLCHTNGITAVGTVNTLFGKAMRQRGLLLDSPATLDSALNKLESDQVDSDKDGTTDVDELKAARNPNVADAPTDGGVTPGPDEPFVLPPVKYGCGSTVVPGFVFIAAALLPLARKRKQC